MSLGTRHFPYNENLMTALNTPLLKCCLSSTDAVDKWGKNSRMRMKVRSYLMQARFIEIHQFSQKNKVGYFSKRVVHTLKQQRKKSRL